MKWCSSFQSPAYGEIVIHAWLTSYLEYWNCGLGPCTSPDAQHVQSVGSMRQTHLSSCSHFIALIGNVWKIFSYLSFLFCTKSSLYPFKVRNVAGFIKIKLQNQNLSKKTCCFEAIQYHVNLRTKIHITKVSENTKEHKKRLFCAMSPHYCYFLSHFSCLLFDHWIQLTIFPTCTTILLRPSLFPTE